MLYFAYGSNMDWDQMRERCPSARFVGVAKLPGHRLAFSRRSRKRNCGVADAVEDQGSDVWGVVYEIDDQDIARLDVAEGYSPGRAKNAYRREERHVFVDGAKSTPLSVAVYFAIPEENPSLPNEDYKSQILKGANHWHLPQEYIRDVLERIEAE